MTAGEDDLCAPAHAALASALVETLILQHALRTRVSRTVIAIAGESGSGKSVTALCLARELATANLPAHVLHQDDYFHRPPSTNHAHRVRDLRSVGPQEVDLALLRAHVAAFRSGETHVDAPRVDYAGNRFVRTERDFSRRAILIVEGTYVLEHVHSDVRIFLDATSDDTRERRAARNRDIDAPIVEQVLAIEHPLIAAQAEHADIRIDRHFRIARTAL